MVFQKRLDYGFSGYQVPPTPRAPRSSRKRALFKKKVDEIPMCAFDLLATLAGKILGEGEKSVGVECCGSGEVMEKEISLFDKSMKVEPYDSTSYQRSYKLTNNVSEVHNPKPALKLSPPYGMDSWSGLANSNSSIKGYSNLRLPSKIEVEYLHSEPLIEPEVGKHMKSGLSDAVKPAIGVDAATYGFEVQNPEPSLHYFSAVKIPVYGGVRGTPNVKISNRDDDEKSSGCTQPSTLTKPYRTSPPRIVDRRIRKFVAYKYWNVANKLKDGGAKEVHKTGVDKQPNYQKQRCFRRQRSQRKFPFKKRKMYCHGPLSNSDDRATVKHMNKEAFDSVVGTSSSIMGGNGTFKRRGSHVKLKIKSFRVPELFIEMSEMATVGSLKTVMEAVTAILGDGLHIGAFLHGKKIADDRKTLLQTGMSHDNLLDSVEFSLEPNTSEISRSLPSGNSSHMLPAKTPQPSTWYMPHEVGRGSSDMLLGPPLAKIGNFVESDYHSAPSPGLSMDKFVGNSREIIPVQGVKMEVVPTSNPIQSSESKRSEAAQRRIRRPFSVSEVESLVQAVEKLGTGRWRDVKVQAFENAKHRTYVDLKDKWKTLVHTAKISPQQRRGEPVPQELLDRVLDAHAYWSLQQAKQQLKHGRETQLFL